MPGPDQLATFAHRLRETAEGTPEREELLRRLAEEIRSGVYEIDAEVLAQKIIEDSKKRRSQPAGN